MYNDYKMTNTLNEIILNFKMDKPKKTVFGNYRIKDNELLYVAQTTEERSFSKDKENGITSSVLIDKFKEWAKENNAKKFVIGYSKEEVDAQAVVQSILKDNWRTEVKARTSESNTIAKKVKQGDKMILLGNSAILPLVGRTVAYGNENRNNRETEIQRIMTRDVDFQMIPFSVFEQANLDLNKFVLIERGVEETLKHKVEDRSYKINGKPTFTLENRHFTGASLFSVDGKCYLFDVDRREVEHDIFNPFLAQVPKSPKSIKEAYELLKPKEVLDAEKKNAKILRQGEWFFIPTKKPKIKKLSTIEKYKLLASGRFGLNDELAKLLGVDGKKLTKQNAELIKGVPRQQNLQAGNSRPNTVSMLLEQDKKIYCSGVVKHTGREHADLKLNGWYLAVANTSTQNVTVTGDID